MFDYAIIGKGLIGSAAARYVSQVSDNVAIIGPDEPMELWHEHQGVFASHYDQGRITRVLDANLAWARLAQRSIAEYASIEAASGIRFYHPCGGIQIGPAPQSPEDYMARTDAVAKMVDAEYVRYSGAEFRSLCPALDINDGYTVFHEPNVAGYINPRPLVAAQLKIAQEQGATLIRETVVNMKPLGQGTELRTDLGQRVQARRVLVAAGAWSQFLLGHDLGLVPTPRTVVMAQLSDAEAARLQHLPSVIFYAGLNDPNLNSIYMLPPIRYPDGHIYLKIGGHLKEIDYPKDAVALEAWFQSDGSKLEAESLENTLFDIIPSLQAESIMVKPCVITMTATGEPLLTEVEPSQIAVVSGGCGAAAKSSNEIGRLGAALVLGM